jgi:predicted amidohydrolase YtcJ
MLYADRVFQHGHILTLDPATPMVQALAVRDGRIVAVGTDREMAELGGPGTRFADLGGCTVVPGFHDAHCHILLFGLGLTEVNVRAAPAIAAIAAAVAERAARQPRGTWIRGGGYNQDKLAEQRHPMRADLGMAAPDHPVFLSHVSGHMAVANSRALATAGIDTTTPNPPGGVIEHDAQGEPTGLLLETAQELVKRVLPPYTLSDLRAALGAAGRQMAAEGITSAQDAWAGWIAPQEFRAYQEASAMGALPQHIRLMPDAERLAIKDGRFDFAFGLHTGFGDERLKLGAMKFFLDGSLIGRTAALSAPYSDTPADCGFLVKSEEEIQAQIARAHRGGWQVAMHAIGDRAIAAGLDAIEACMGGDAPRYRPRIEHCGVLRPDLIARIRRLGVVIVTQPRFITELGDGIRTALGEERLRLTYPMASLRGLRVAFSSDRPVVNGAPLLGIAAACTQRTAGGVVYAPQEAITLDQAFAWYTGGSAYAAFAEDEQGTLSPGKWADLVVLAENPFVAGVERVAEIRVLQTVIRGAVVFEQ